MNRIIQSFLSLFPYVKSLKALADLYYESEGKRIDQSLKAQDVQKRIASAEKRNRALEAQIESLNADEIFVNKKYAMYKSLKAEVDTLEQEIQAQLSEQRSLESLKAENESLRQEVAAYREDRTPSLKAQLAKAKARTLKAQRRATKHVVRWEKYRKAVAEGAIVVNSDFLSEN